MKKKERGRSIQDSFFSGKSRLFKALMVLHKEGVFSIIVCLSVPPPPLSYQSYSKMPGGMSLFDVKRVEGEKIEVAKKECMRKKQHT